jgi:hypothetical protein
VNRNGALYVLPSGGEIALDFGGITGRKMSPCARPVGAVGIGGFKELSGESLRAAPFGGVRGGGPESEHDHPKHRRIGRLATELANASIGLGGIGRGHRLEARGDIGNIPKNFGRAASAFAHHD